MDLFQLPVVLASWGENIPIRVNQMARSSIYLKLCSVKCYGDIFLGH